MKNTKETIILAVMEMLDGANAEEITVRDVISRLNISVSAINYHFGSKENMMRGGAAVYRPDHWSGARSAPKNGGLGF